jgi:hypothetical protein
MIVGRAKDIKCDDVGASGDAGKVIAAAKKYLGKDYCWGGGDANGPTHTPDCPSGVKDGFDCSGLTLYAYAQVGITLGHYTGDQWNAGRRVGKFSDLRPGDLIFFSTDHTEAGIHHVGMYLGNDEMIHAPHTGDVVRIVPGMSKNSYWMQQFIGGVRILKDQPEGSGSPSGKPDPKALPPGTHSAPATLAAALRAAREEDVTGLNGGPQ